MANVLLESVEQGANLQLKVTHLDRTVVAYTCLALIGSYM